MQLKGKKLIITGAGRGIGQSIAKHCAVEGATVVLLSRTINELRETEKAVSDAGGKAYSKVCNISVESSVGEAYDFAVQNCGTIDALVNNAGIQPPIGPLAKVNSNDWRKNIEVNLFGALNCIRAVLPDMMQKRKGKIINLSGGGATSPRPNFTAYGVSKTALVRLTETLALELRDFNIDVNAISPGAINTKMLEEVIQAGEMSGNELDESRRRKISGGDDPGAAAELVSFLASDESDGITGKLISARWDPWRELEFQNLLRTDEDFATLRRIDGKNYIRRA